MNTITLMPPVSKYEWTGKIGDLIRGAFKSSRSAFIGNIGDNIDELFLVSYEGIMLADTPNSTWNSKGDSIYVTRFVDVNITVIGDSKNE